MGKEPGKTIIHFNGKGLYLNLPHIICFEEAKEILATMEDIKEVIEKRLMVKT